MQMEVEDLVGQPGRDNIPKLDKNGVNGSWFNFTKNGINKSIRRMFHQFLDKPYKSYQEIPQKMQDQFLRCFAQEFNWLPNITETVKREYHDKAHCNYNKSLCQWKTKLKTGDCPTFRPNKTWWKDIIEFQGTEPAETTSSRNSKNRMSERAGNGPTTNNGGVTSMDQRRKRKNGVEPDWIMLLEDLHTNKKTKMIQDPVAAEYIGKCKEAAEERLSQLSMEGSVDSNILPLEEIAKIVQETILVIKDHRLGMGKPSEDIHVGTPSSFAQAEKEKLKQEIQSLREIVVGKEAGMKSYKAQTLRMMRLLEAKYPEDFPPEPP